MDNDLIYAIRILEKLNNNSCNFYRAHLFTTENISGFSKKISFKDKTILTVCSSGDQAFNMIYNGAKEVNLFDIDIFTKYYFYLKEAAVRGLNYEDFLKFFSTRNFFNNKLFSLDIYLEFRKYINDDKIRHFWDYLFCHYPGKSILESSLFVPDNNYTKTIIERNDYLKSEYDYEILKENLKMKKFKFFNINLFKEFITDDKKYDFIYLSNIFDYLNTENEIIYLEKIKDIILKMKNNLTNDGMIAVSYLYFYFDDFLNSLNVDSLSYLKNRDELFEDFYCITFPGVAAPYSRQLRNRDALMMYKNN